MANHNDSSIGLRVTLLESRIKMLSGLCVVLMCMVGLVVYRSRAEVAAPQPVVQAPAPTAPAEPPSALTAAVPNSDHKWRWEADERGFVARELSAAGDVLREVRLIGDAAPPETAAPYDTQADAERDLASALQRATTEHKRVLLVFGANWCKWCRRLDYTFTHDDAVKRVLEASYVVVHVDVGARGTHKNAAIATRYGRDLPDGLPALAIVAADGTLVKSTGTGELEVLDRHDPARIVSYLAP